MARLSIQDKSVYLGIILFFILCVIISVSLDGTVDSGDSIMHFLYSKYSFKHPEFFFHHWAKPLFVLSSCLFSNFGFAGIKIFNSLVVSLTILFTYLSAKIITGNSSYIGLLSLCFAPLNFILIFSGLTEPLFALLLILSIYLFISGKEISSVVLISFLPFARSEGLFFIGVFALYFIFSRKYKLLPLLITGHLVYSIAGFFYYNDFLWVFTKIPYSKLSSTYGSGPVTHFVNQMTYAIGIPLYILLALGIIYMGSSFLYSPFRKNEIKYKEKLLLVYGGFVVFFVAHSLFWYLGIFNSMGLKRVLICVIPLIALISVDGFNFITIKLITNKVFSRIAGSFIILYIVIFPFTSNPAAIKWNKELFPGKDQLLIKEMCVDIKENYGNSLLYYFHPCISFELGVDHFDTKIRKELPEIFEKKEISKDALIIWDGWFSVVENGISLEQIQKDGRFKEIKEYSSGQSRFVLFKTKETD